MSRSFAHFPPLMAAILLAVMAGPVAAQDDQSIVLLSTTSTANSGLYDHLLPIFQGQSGIRVNVVSVGTGQAIRNAQNCDGDVLLVHAKDAENAFVAAGYGTARTDLMYNDFVIVGPQSDPAMIDGMADAQGAFGAIAQAEALFVSRGDDSGTHKAELGLWGDTGVDPGDFSRAWYREAGSGMGATLNIAIGMDAYVLVDRATWISFENKQDFEIKVQGDADLYNQYGLVPVNPDVCPNVNAENVAVFVEWLTSASGQDAIAAFMVDDQQLFYPNAPRF